MSDLLLVDIDSVVLDTGINPRSHVDQAVVERLAVERAS